MPQSRQRPRKRRKTEFFSVRTEKNQKNRKRSPLERLICENSKEFSLCERQCPRGKIKAKEVKKIKKEQNKAIYTVIFMIFFTLLAKILGLFRSTVTAGIFAAGMEGIAFSAASKIPFAIFDMLFSTAILGSFLPIYRGHLLSDEKRAKAFSSVFLTFTGVITGITALFGVIFARPIVSLAAPNLDAETLALAASLLKIMFPAVIFAGMTYTLIGVVQSHEKFLLPAMVSAVSNTVILAYLAVCSSFESKMTAVYGLAIAYLVSWFVQFSTLAIPLIKTRKMPCFSAKFKDNDLVLAEKRALPVMFGAWLIPMTTLTANAFSSYIDAESIGENIAQGAAIVIFENAFSVFSIAGGLMTYGICNYLFPKLSAKFQGGDKEGFGASARMGLSISLAVTIPIAAAVFILSDEIIRFLYLRGNFTEALADAAAKSLKMLSLALPAYSVLEFLSRTAYSCGKVVYPMVSAFVGIASGGASALVFLVTDALSVSSVALSAGIGLTVAAITELLLSRRLLGLPFESNIPKKILFFSLGILFSALTMVFSHEILKKIVQKPSTFENLVIIAIVFILGSMVYLIWIFLIRRLLSDGRSNRKEDTSDG